ncbi:hypothetical protein TeGR_g10751 [Tetraparma gracilis]|uniref:Uncharacterized protein n=1 Tax=Tetraparma gracilis TaxID=2962635 RepID=A0ABQ6MI11_9STRA|nr:hypothetical protein TeGR_g10751 [Tetraparma gracilis]
MLQAFSSFAQKHDRIAAVGSGLTFGFLGDVMAQSLSPPPVSDLPPRTTIDLNRSLTVSGYVGTAALVFWHPFFSIMEARLGPARTPTKVLLTNLFALPLVDIPAFNLSVNSRLADFDTAKRRLAKNYGRLVVASWCIWVPVMCVVFRPAISTHLRLPIMYACDMAWAATLSYIGAEE